MPIQFFDCLDFSSTGKSEIEGMRGNNRGLDTLNSSNNRLNMCALGGDVLKLHTRFNSFDGKAPSFRFFAMKNRFFIP